MTERIHEDLSEAPVALECRRYEGLMPWAVSGRSRLPVLADLVEHAASCADCRRAMRDLVSAAIFWDQHPSVEQILDYSTGEPASLQVEQHIASCQRCQEELELLSTAQSDTSSPARPQPVRGWLAMVAAGLLMVIVAYGTSRSSPPLRVGDDLVDARHEGFLSSLSFEEGVQRSAVRTGSPQFEASEPIGSGLLSRLSFE